jgi:ribonuclease III
VPKSRIVSSEQRDRLTRVLGHGFDHQPDLLERALTHRSFSSDNYERLEFLGDSILNFVIAESICDRFPDTDEGTLSRLRSSLVRCETLAEIGRELDLGSYLILGSGELKSGGYDRDSILEDVLEAIIGAIYRDAGIASAKEFILRIFSERLRGLNLSVSLKDPKTRLQELLQKHGRDLPVYNILDVSGPPHHQTFKIECHLQNPEEIFNGKGSSRRKAEQDAASLALRELTAEH